MATYLAQTLSSPKLPPNTRNRAAPWKKNAPQQHPSGKVPSLDSAGIDQTKAHGFKSTGDDPKLHGRPKTHYGRFMGLRRVRVCSPMDARVAVRGRDRFEGDEAAAWLLKPYRATKDGHSLDRGSSIPARWTAASD
jgi:hypothetical protein